MENIYMKLNKKLIKMRRITFNPMSALSIVVLSMGILSYVRLEVAHNLRGVTLIFGNESMNPQFISIATAAIAYVSLVSLASIELLRSSKQVNTNYLEIILFRVIAPTLIVLGGATFFSPSLMDAPDKSSPSLGAGAIISGSLIILSGLCLSYWC
jgi:hypothetical protein